MPTLCKHAENRHACTRCRDDEIERLRGELLLITQLQAGDGSTVNGLTKDQLGRAFRQAQDIARAALGIVTHGDSISGSVNPDQPPTVLTNPWNGEPRDIRDVESDPTGILMVEPGKPLRAADQPNVAPSIEWRLTTEKINDLQIDSIKRLIPLCKAAHFVNVRVRINGTWEEYQADWIKHMVRIERAADPTPAPQPQCACEYYWPGQGHHPDCPTRNAAQQPTSPTTEVQK